MNFYSKLKIKNIKEIRAITFGHFIIFKRIGGASDD